MVSKIAKIFLFQDLAGFESSLYLHVDALKAGMELCFLFIILQAYIRVPSKTSIGNFAQNQRIRVIQIVFLSNVLHLNLGVFL